MLAIGWSTPRGLEVEVREVSRDGVHATVEVAAAARAPVRLALVRVAGAWRVELP
jgi:hypothetical protein